MEYPDKKANDSPGDQDVDLGAFFTLLSRAAKQIIHWIRLLLTAIVNTILFLLLLFKKNLLWIGLGALVGIGFCIYSYLNSKNTYYATMVVKCNFHSSRLLYNKIEYFNSLIGQRKLGEISKIIGLETNESRMLKRFIAEPVADKFQTAILYRDNLLTPRRNQAFWADTMWSRTITYRDFESQLTKFDYPLHEIKLYSADPGIFHKVQQGFLKSLQNNSTLLTAQKVAKESYNLEEAILTNSINSLDTLSDSYVKRIRQSSPSIKGEGTNLILSDKELRSPELDLFNTKIILKNDLMALRKRSVEESEIIQVISDFNDTGTKMNKIRSNYLYNVLIAAGIAYVIILLLEGLRFLGKVEKRMYAKS